MRPPTLPRQKNRRTLQVLPVFHIAFHRCGKRNVRFRDRQRRDRLSSAFEPARSPRTVENVSREAVVILRVPPSSLSQTRTLENCETHLPAERAPSQAPARVSSADVLARRPGDSQASPRERPQAAVRLSEPAQRADVRAMQTATAKRAPLGIFARPGSALADPGSAR